MPSIFDELASRARSCAACSCRLLSGRLQIPRKGIERDPRDDLLGEQLSFPIVVLLRQQTLRLGAFGAGGRLVKRGLQFSDVLLGLRELRPLLVEDVLLRLGIDPKQLVEEAELLARVSLSVSSRPMRLQLGGISDC
jgi:hypothetical protein